MGREGGSSGGAIAVIVVGGIMTLLALGCVGLGAVGFLFTARSAAPQVATVSQGPADIVSVAPSRVITNNAEGLAVIDGQVYTDDELRELFAPELSRGEDLSVAFEFTADLSAERRAEIEQLVFGSTESPDATEGESDPEPPETVPNP